MKQFVVVCCLLIVSLFSFSFALMPGGDVFEIYLNGQRVHQQFVHAGNAVKTISLTAAGNNDKVEVLYSHCGKAGKKRVLIFRNEKNETIKTMSFADAGNNRSLMQFYTRDVPLDKKGHVKMYYSSEELPQGHLLANLNRGKQMVVARTVSL